MASPMTDKEMPKPCPFLEGEAKIIDYVLSLAALGYDLDECMNNERLRRLFTKTRAPDSAPDPRQAHLNNVRSKMTKSDRGAVVVSTAPYEENLAQALAVNAQIASEHKSDEGLVAEIERMIERSAFSDEPSVKSVVYMWQDIQRMQELLPDILTALRASDRDSVIEECAKVAHGAGLSGDLGDWDKGWNYAAVTIAEAIRELKRSQS